MDANLVVDGLKFMVLGMTTVYLFLLLMIFVLNIISKVVKKYYPTKKLNPIKIRRRDVVASKPDDNGALVAAIAASIQEFKKQK